MREYSLIISTSADIEYRSTQMLATPPVNFSEPGVSAGNTDPNESASAVAGSSQKFQLTYDKLVIAVGAYSQSMSSLSHPSSAKCLHALHSVQCPRREGTRVLPQGYQRRTTHSHKGAGMSANRARIHGLCSDDWLAGFEQANQPTITDADRRKLLNFCIVGGGPTGVEFAAELHDFLHTDIARHYPALARMAKINLYDVAPSILGGFDIGLQECVYRLH